MVVVTQVLTNEMIDAGQVAVQRLDQARFPFSAALWLFDAEIRAWKFVIASPSRESTGPKVMYQTTRKVLTQSGRTESPIPLQDVSIVPSTEPLIVRLRKLAKVREAGVRMTGNTTHGHYVEDAYVYRMD